MRNLLGKIGNKKSFLIIFIFVFSLFIPILLEMNIMNVNATEPLWWDDNWNFRRKISLFHLDSLDDYQMLIELPVSEYIDNTLSNGADIRFVKDDHATVLNHWIEEWDESGITNKVWVKVDIDTSYLMGYIIDFYMYYGNFAAPSTSNGKNTFAFFEDFSGTSLDTTTWTTGEYTGGTHDLTVSNGELHIYAQSTAIENSGYWFKTINSFDLTNFALHAEARVENMDFVRGAAYIGDIYFTDEDNQRTGLAVGDYGSYYLSRFQYTDDAFVKSAISPNTGTGTIITDYKVYGNSWDMDVSGTWSMSYNPTINTFTRPFKILSYAFVQYWTSTVTMDVFYDIIYLRSYSTVDPTIEVFDEEIGNIPPVDIISIEILNSRVFKKGEKIDLQISIKNNQPFVKEITTVSWKVESLESPAKDGFGVNVPYMNLVGPIILEGSCEVPETSPLILNPGETRNFVERIEYEGYSNGAMNIGKWQINSISIEDTHGAIAVSIPTQNDFDVVARDKNDGPHPVFIYYLWNSGGSGETFEGDDPSNYFINGYGEVKAGFFRFLDPNIVPVTFDFSISYNNPAWDIPATGLTNEVEVRENGIEKVCDDLNIYAIELYDNPSRRHCGFDAFMFGAARHFFPGTMGINTYQRYCFFMAGTSTSPANFEINIDGCVQHQLSHFFDALVSSEHFFMTNCINNWWWPYDGLHEPYDPFFGPTYEFCQGCRDRIDANWDKFYTIVF